MTNIKKSVISGAAALLLSAAWAAQAFSQTAPGVREQIDNIQALIDKNGGKWVAGETSLSGLSREEWQQRVGLSFTELKGAPLADLPADRLPASLDWRSAGGNFVTGVRNQKKCGDCWAFALTGALESYAMRRQNAPGADLDLSEQVLLSCSGIGSCNGGTLDGAYLQNTGLPLESAYPYTAADGSCASAAPGWQNSVYRIDGWGTVSRSVNSLKAALAKYGPLPTGMMVYEDLMHYKSGVYSYTAGKKLGGHAVIIVGYNDADQSFTVKNSWGPGWGEGGFFRIAYSEVTGSASFGMSTIAYKANAGKETARPFDQDSAWARVAPLFGPLLQWGK